MRTPASPRLLSRLSRTAHLAYGAAAALAASAIWGWALGLPRLGDFGADYLPLRPGNAVGVLLLAASFLAAQRPGRRARVASYTAASLAAALAILGLIAQPLGLIPAL